MILIHPSIDPVIFSIGFLDIRWYGLSYVLAFILGSFLIKKFNINLNSSIKDKIIDKFFIWSIFGVILGGRIGYVLFYQFENFILNPIYIFYIWQGGMSFHGGLAGMIISIFLFSKINNISFFQLADLISLVAPIGLFFGRLANFVNIELIGRPTNFFISIIYPTIDYLPRHPSQLYEAFLEGFLLFIILLYFFKKYYSINNAGSLSGIFLIFYGLFRFLVEFLREPDQHIGLLYNYLTMGQILCIPLTIIGFIILLKNKKYA